tara:strand:+ start:35356 stop:35565 length:210 start_codon:yes stop_codon:yes gene_type:complete
LSRRGRSWRGWKTAISGWSGSSGWATARNSSRNTARPWRSVKGHKRGSWRHRSNNRTRRLICWTSSLNA